MIQPKAHRSEDLHADLSVRSSGDTYSAVPTKELAREEISSLESCGVATGLSWRFGTSSSFAVPKSVIFIRILASSRILKSATMVTDNTFQASGLGVSRLSHACIREHPE
jgi:hypothetical protein